MSYLTDTQKDLLVQIHNARTMSFDALLHLPSVQMSTSDFNCIVSHLSLIHEQSFGQIYVYRLAPETEMTLRADGRIK